MPGESADKVRRQEAILEILRGDAVPSQEALRRALRRKGFPATQGTLSRDLHELGVVRAPAGDGYRYHAPGSDSSVESQGSVARGRMRSVASAEVRRIEANESTVVVFTLNGRAQGVAVYLDSLKLDDVLATVAGDDTILIVPRSVRTTRRILRDLTELFGLN